MSNDIQQLNPTAALNLAVGSGGFKRLEAPSHHKVVTTASTISAWADATGYVVGSTVSYSGTNYICIANHTSNLANDRPSTGASWTDYWITYTEYTDVLEWRVIKAVKADATYEVGCVASVGDAPAEDDQIVETDIHVVRLTSLALKTGTVYAYFK